MAAAAHRALIVATAAATFPDSDTPAGCFAEELAAPYNAWTSAGYDVDIATIGGSIISWAPDSLKGDARTKAVDHFFADAAAMAKANNPKSLETVDVTQYDIVFIPGGHGAMLDLPDDATLQELLAKAWAQGSVIASVCHGPAALVRVKDPASGELLLRGKRVACFTNEEEMAVGMVDAVPFLLEDAVKKAGATHELAKAWNAHVVRDDRLVTGQNPASSPRVATVALEAARDVGRAPAATPATPAGAAR